MDTDKYIRSISLNCPSCACTQLSTEEGTIEDALFVTCTNCGLEIFKEDLKTANSENIEEHWKEIGEEVVKDFQKELKNALQNSFKGSKFIKFK
jgi:uncharacterized Zn finger protein